LTDEFQARISGLPVVWEHPVKKALLDSEEFGKRVVGTVMLPYVKGDEIWSICRLYDDEAIKAITEDQLSTSPSVVFSPADGNQTVKLEDGKTLLIEGVPSYICHLAICPNGVWDKLGPPDGIRTDFPTTSTEGTVGMAENIEKLLADILSGQKTVLDNQTALTARMDSIDAAADKVRKDAAEAEEKATADKARRDAARKDRFGARKDGESYKDWKARHDADETAMMDAMRKDGDDEETARGCAKDARKDSEDREAGEGGETFKKWAEEENGEDEHREDAARMNSVTQENADLKARLTAMEATMKGLTTERSVDESAALGAAQARADSIAAQFGDKAPAPFTGEASLSYRKRLVGRFQRHSARFKDAKLDGLDATQLGAIEDFVYQDAQVAARNPATGAGLGKLIAHTRHEGGREVTTYTGDPMSWMQPFMSGAQVGTIRNHSTSH
jgi:hypothetical protein